MKRPTVMFAVITTAIFLSCEKKDITSNTTNITNPCPLEQFTVDNYTDDARNLYFSEILADSNHANYHEKQIDNSQVQSILKTIQAVYCLDVPERDTVFTLNSIHGYYCYSYHAISLEVNTNLPEIENLANGIIPTGNVALDSLLLAYHFDSVKTSFSYPNTPWLTIYTADEYNMIPIQQDLEALDQIILAEMSLGCVGDGHNITLLRDGDASTLTFSIGSGDCPSGCLYHRYWEFNVTNDIATFVRTY
jgi:hypothetical protein